MHQASHHGHETSAAWWCVGWLGWEPAGGGTCVCGGGGVVQRGRSTATSALCIEPLALAAAVLYQLQLLSRGWGKPASRLRWRARPARVRARASRATPSAQRASLSPPRLSTPSGCTTAAATARGAMHRASACRQALICPAPPCGSDGDERAPPPHAPATCPLHRSLPARPSPLRMHTPLPSSPPKTHTLAALHAALPAAQP